jgi:hypothetical protein
MGHLGDPDLIKQELGRMIWAREQPVDKLWSAVEDFGNRPQPQPAQALILALKSFARQLYPHPALTLA